MSAIEDPDRMRRQYRDASNLNKRAGLHARFSVNPLGVWAWAFDHYAFPPDARILELGCGPGAMWVECADRVQADWAITLTDFSPGMVDDAQRAVSGCAGLRPGQFRFRAIDAQDIDDAGSSYDAVLANFMLYHVPDRPRVFGHVRRVLAPGGAFYAITVGDGHLREIFDLRREFDPDTDFWGGRDSADPVAFTLQNGRAQLAPHFSSVVLIEYPDALRVTDADALAGHALSGVPDLAEDKRRAFTAMVRRKMDDNGGVLAITKETGLFICTP